MEQPQPGEIWQYRFSSEEDDIATVIVIQQTGTWHEHYDCFGLESGEIDGWSFEKSLMHKWTRLA